MATRVSVTAKKSARAVLKDVFASGPRYVKRGDPDYHRAAVAVGVLYGTSQRCGH